MTFLADIVQALKALQLDVARKSFVRLKDTRYTTLVKKLETEVLPN